uniref:RNA helicase n=1 Tax=Steinernema glaseri TaxID=37863 RepID=A0A1I8AQ67_9BILA
MDPAEAITALMVGIPVKGDPEMIVTVPLDFKDLQRTTVVRITEIMNVRTSQLEIDSRLLQENERSRYQQPDPVTSRPIYEAERPRRAQFGEDNVNRRTAEVLGPYQEKARRFQEAEAGRQRQQNGEHSQDQAVRKPPSSYVPRDVDVDELFIADKECASQSTLDTDDIIFEDNTEPSDFVPFKTWKDANLPEALMTNIRNCGYKEPRNIQAFTMPLIENDHDVLGQAETGSGKSAAFLLPIIKHCMITKKKDDLLAGAPVALIICPTRELVSQLYDQGRKFATGCNVQVQRAYGEFKVYENARQIRLGCDILVATVGRLKQFVDDGTVKFDNLTYLVLDEADHLIETNHYDSLLDIIRHPKFPDISHRQTLLFSATFSAEVEGVATKILRSERKVIISNRRKTSANTKITQEFRMVKKDQKKDELLKMLKDEQQKNGSIKRTIVFVQMKRQADVLAAFISMADIKATTIHGDRSQQLREEALRDFKGNTRVLVTTDVCARGIDILDLDHVVNFDLPNDKTTYIHRIGRTGRTREGLATSFIDPTDSQDQQISRDLIEIAAEAGQEVPPFLVKLADEGCEENGEE